MIYRIILELAGLFVGLMICLTFAFDMVSDNSNLSVTGGLLLFVLSICGTVWAGIFIYRQVRKEYFNESAR